MGGVIEAVYFDGDQTLWDFGGAMRRALASTAELLQRRVSTGVRVDVDALIADRDTAAAELDPAVHGHEQVRLVAFRRTLARLGIRDDGFAEELTEFYLERRFSEVVPYSDVVSMLLSLRRTYAIGLLSNGNSYPDRIGLDGLFDVMVFAHEHGVPKPDRRLFEVAARRVDREPATIAMVGDSLPDDVAGAQASGWRGIWLNRIGAPNDGAVRPDAEITAMAELPGALGGPEPV